MPERPPEKFSTKRLFLRKPVIEDAVPIFENYAQDPEVTRFLTWKSHKSINETKFFIQRCEKVWEEGSAFPWSIVRKYDNQLLGMIEIVMIDHAGVNLGYVLARPFWGEGYMVEALRIITKWAINQNDIFRVWAFCDVENTTSARVLEKSGMDKEGILRRWIRLPQFGEIPRDCFCYSIVK